MAAISRIDSLQILRAIAATAVVYAHAIDVIPDQSRQSVWQLRVPNLENFGCVGVDIFFVISGVVIALVCCGGRYPQSGKFLLRRAARLYPPYLLVTAWVGLHMMHESHPVPAYEWIRSIFLLPPIRSVDDPYVLIIGWTLGFEMWFYVLAAASLLIGRRALGVRLIAVPAAFVLAGLFFKNTAALSVFITNPIQIEFVFGVCIGVLLVRGWRTSFWQAVALCAAGVLWLTASLVRGYGNIDQSGLTMNGELSWQRVGIWGIGAGMIVAGFALGELSSGWKAPAWGLLIGDASYGLYLVSKSSIGVFDRLWARLGHPAPDAFILISTVGTIAVGCAFYMAFDRPVQQWLKGLLQPKPAPQPVAVSV
jgi:peptidoglycan/LPS O-acetylase OafA/YrhL